MSTAPETVSKPRPRALTAAIWAGSFVALLWVIEIIDALMQQRLDNNGVRPLTVDGLWGILFAPVLHDDWAHLISNSVPAFVLTFVIIASSGTMVWIEATAMIWVGAGVGTWLLGGLNSNHVGASSLIFGWVAFLVLRGVFARKLSEILIGVVIAAVYGYIIWGVLPTNPAVSWQGHLCGAIAGVMAAAILGRRSLAERNGGEQTDGLLNRP